MTIPLAQLRLDLAIAKASLRTAKDDEATAKVIATLEIAGKNDDERKRNAAFALVTDTNYQKALGHLRGCEYDVDTLEAQIQNEEDQIRLRELQAREKLADALLGRRSDDAAADELAERHHADYLLNAMDEQYNKTHVIKPDYEATQRAGYQEPIFPAGSNAGEYYPNDWYK